MVKEMSEGREKHWASRWPQMEPHWLSYCCKPSNSHVISQSRRKSILSSPLCLLQTALPGEQAALLISKSVWLMEEGQGQAPPPWKGEPMRSFCYIQGWAFITNQAFPPQEGHLACSQCKGKRSLLKLANRICTYTQWCIAAFKYILWRFKGRRCHQSRDCSHASEKPVGRGWSSKECFAEIRRISKDPGHRFYIKCFGSEALVFSE